MHNLVLTSQGTCSTSVTLGLELLGWWASHQLYWMCQIVPSWCASCPSMAPPLLVLSDRWAFVSLLTRKPHALVVLGRFVTLCCYASWGKWLWNLLRGSVTLTPPEPHLLTSRNGKHGKSLTQLSQGSCPTDLWSVPPCFPPPGHAHP